MSFWLTHPNSEHIIALIEHSRAHPDAWCSVFDKMALRGTPDYKSYIEPAWEHLRDKAGDEGINTNPLYEYIVRNDRPVEHAKLCVWMVLHGLLTGDYSYMLECSSSELILLARLGDSYAALLSIAVIVFEIVNGVENYAI